MASPRRRRSKSGSRMKPELARRTASSASGPGAERDPVQPADQRYDNAYLFGAICPARGVGAALALPYADTDMMQLHLDEISTQRRPGRACRPAARSRRMAYDRQARRAQKHHADLPAFPRPGAEPGRERLAISPPELALKHRLRKLRRHRRRRLRRLAKAHRPARTDHIHRNARMGPRRS